MHNPNRKHGPHKRRKNMARLLDTIPESRRLLPAITRSEWRSATFDGWRDAMPADDSELDLAFLPVRHSADA